MRIHTFMRSFALIAFLISGPLIAADRFTQFINTGTDIDWSLWGLLREETFSGKNIVYLNNNNPEDQVFYFRHTWDTNAQVGYGLEKYGCRVSEFKASIRQRTIWGFAGSTAKTAEADIKVGDVVTSPHSHDLPRLFVWMREGWLKVKLNQALALPFENQHTVTVGAFPFELGRGIALGAAYAVGPTPLGFYSDSIIDQFAFGIKFSGELLKDVLTYDIYGTILQARSFSISETGRKILGQQFGHLNNQMRGFGKDNYLVAARLYWTVFNNEYGNLSFEPYVLYNNDPEQKVEVIADASSKLGTWGLAGEYEGCKLGCGFDLAFNMGRQSVKGLDRNKIIFQNNTDNGDGFLAEVNSQVQLGSATGPNVLFVNGGPNQDIIFDADLDGEQSQNLNGQLIINSTDLYNSLKRFRNPYHNTYHGMMFVGDAGYWIYKKDLQVAATVGYASGGRDPNLTPHDETYDGFIPLQEVYMGKRVKSVFVLGTVGKLKRPGIAPVKELSLKEFSTVVSGFTNIAFLGSGFTWKPCSSCRKLTINPNVFVYWEPFSGNKFDAKTQKDIPSSEANNFLGTEANLFLSCYVFDSLKLWGIGSVFFPDGHFKDIKGKPLDKDQSQALNKLNRTGFKDDKIPNIGDNIGFTVNIGMDYAF